MYTKLISLLVLMVCLTLSAPQSAMAADRDIPLQMLSMRDRLLRDRSQLLVMRSDYNQRIQNMQRIQQDMDKLLYSNTLCRAQYDDLALAKGKLLVAINELQKRLDSVEKGLLTNNADLANVDYYIQRYACLR